MDFSVHSMKHGTNYVDIPYGTLTNLYLIISNFQIDITLQKTAIVILYTAFWSSTVIIL
jgi:hypothetical protein